MPCRKEQAPIRADAIRHDAVTEYLSLSRQRQARVRHRAVFAGVVIVVGGIGCTVAVWTAPALVMRA
jgi:hypothetical protein